MFIPLLIYKVYKMANEVFIGSNVDVYFSKKTDNTSIQGTDFALIDQVSVYPETGGSRNVIEVVNFSNPETAKLVGKKSVPDVTLQLNYIIGDPQHEALKALFESGERAQFKIIYWMDQAKTIGIVKIYNGFIASISQTGGDDTATQLTFVISVNKTILNTILDNSNIGAGSNP